MTLSLVLLAWLALVGWLLAGLAAQRCRRLEERVALQEAVLRAQTQLIRTLKDGQRLHEAHRQRIADAQRAVAFRYLAADDQADAPVYAARPVEEE